MVFNVDPVPILLHGQGHYALSAVKDITVTEEFLGLGQEITNCQTKEYRSDCINRKYLEKVTSSCSCACSFLPQIILSKSGTYFNLHICYCEAQARVRQGSARNGKEWQSRRKASKLKPLPRAYIKVGCHPPTHHPPPTISLILLN